MQDYMIAKKTSTPGAKVRADTYRPRILWALFTGQIASYFFQIMLFKILYEIGSS